MRHVPRSLLTATAPRWAAAWRGRVRALVGMGSPEAEAKHFEEGFNAGGVLVTVNGGARAADALAVLERHGADTGAPA